MKPLLERAHEALANPSLRHALRTGTSQGRRSRAAAFEWLSTEGEAPDVLRDRARQIKTETIIELDRWLDRLESEVLAVGGHVFRAGTGAEACDYIAALARDRGVRSVVKSKSMATEEIELNDALERQGIHVRETDLGEYIVQIAREKPSHIIVPAIHKSQQDVADLFHAELGTPADADAARLTAAARVRLRTEFFDADMGITGANFAVAETGTLVIVENEGNARLSTTVPRIHVAVMGIEKVIRNWEDLSVLLPLLPASATGQKITSYVSFLSGPARDGETDGAREFHLVLLDAGRRRLQADPELSEALNCIRCGACLNACPVYGHIGGHAYGWVYPGPIGAVIGPALQGLRHAGELPFASSLCGACLDACPVKIDIPHLLVRLRADANVHCGSTLEKLMVRLWAWLNTRPGVYRRMAAFVRPLAARMLGVPAPPRRSFIEQWTASRSSSKR